MRLLASISGAIAESPMGAVNSTRGLLRVLRLDPSLIEQFGMTTPPVETPATGPAQEAPVEALAETDRVTVPPEPQGGASLRLLLRIKDGYHITAHEPWPEETAVADRARGIMGLEVSLAPGSGEAVRLEVDYPPGRMLEGSGPLLTHEGEVEVTIRLIRTHAAWKGRPMLLVRWQACTATECLAPTTVELDIAIDPE